MGKVVHNNYITIAKAIGIILMVIGHSGCPQMLSKFIYQFHMPLFFFCSGIFYKEMTSFTMASKYMKKRIIGLYIPFVKWSFFFLFLHNFFMDVGIYNTYYGYEGGSSFYTIRVMMQKLCSIMFTMHGYEELLGGFWFVRDLFISSLIIAAFSILFEKLKNHKHELLCLLFLVLTVLVRRFAPNTELWCDISMGLFGAFFYMFGFLIMRYAHIWRNFFGAILFSLFLLISFFYFKDGISMACGFNKVLPFSISAVSGTLLTLYVSKVIEERWAKVKYILYYIGNHTLDILALHFLSFRLASYIIVYLYGIDTIHVAEHPVIMEVSIPHTYWWCLYCIVGIFFPLILNRIWQVILVFINNMKI